MITHRGDRTNIMANFKVVTKEDFIAYINEGKAKPYWGEQYRYARIGGLAKNLKDMLLKEYNEVFKPDTFTPNQVTGLFRKEISEAYGEHKEWNKAKPLSSKELVVGGVYKDVKGNIEVYLGKVLFTQVPIKDSYNDSRETSIREGYGWYSFWAKDVNNLNEYLAEYGLGYPLKNGSVLKSNRKVYEYTGVTLDLPKVYEWESGGYWAGSKYKCKVERI